MRDYSFLRFKDNIIDAKNMNDRAITEIYYYDSIQLSPNEAYSQITNVEGGISLDGGYTAEIVNCNGDVLSDITDHVFIENITGVNGNNQLKIEIINISEDFGGDPVCLKLSSNISDQAYYSNLFNLTDFQKEQTTFFMYKSYDNYNGIAYENSDIFQAIRLKTYFDIPIDESEIESYFQISRNNTISARVLDKQFERYQIDHISRFTYDRLNSLLKHDVYYIDCVKVTDKTYAESNDMKGLSNLFDTTFTVSKDYSQKKEYEYQIYEGLQLIETFPSSPYTLATIVILTNYAVFNYPITLNTGTLTLHNSVGTIIDTFTEADITTDGAEFNVQGLTDNITVNDTYYINFTSGLFSHIGVDFEGINDTTTWTFIVGDADFLAADFNNDDFFTGE